MDDIFKYWELLNWSRLAFPKVFLHNEDEKYALKDLNYLVGQDLNRGAYRITFRLIDMVENETDWDYIVPEIRATPQFDPRALKVLDENKNDFRGKASDYFYEHETLGGYNNAGGFVTYCSANKYVYLKQLSEIRGDELYNESTNSVVFDFVTYNGNFNAFIYSGFLFTSMAGGELKSDKFIMPMILDIYSKPLAHVLAAIEIIVVLGFILHFGESIKKTYKDAVKYNRLENGINHLLNEQQRADRAKIEPICLRKFRSLITVDRVLRFVFSGLFIAQFILYVGIILFSYDHIPSLVTNDIEYFEDMNKLALAYEVYVEITGFTLFFLVIYSIKYIQINSNVKFLQQTLRKAFRNMASYLLLVSFFWVGLASTAYLGFGHSDVHFSSPFFAFFTTFEIFSGRFEYREMNKADKYLAPIFFSIIMFLMNFILLNLFIAILADAYTRVRFKRSKNKKKGEKKLQFFSSLKNYLIELCHCKRKVDEKKKYKRDKFIKFPINRFVEGLRMLEPHQFAWRQAESIVLEQEMRKECKLSWRQMCDTLSYYSQVDMQDEMAITYKDQMLLNYWNYLRDGKLSIQNEERFMKSKMQWIESEMYELQVVENERIGKRKRRLKKINWYENRVTQSDHKIHELRTKVDKEKAKLEDKSFASKLRKTLRGNSIDELSENVFGEIVKR